MKSNGQSGLGRQRILNAFSYLYLIGSFCIVDVWLRLMVWKIDLYSIRAAAPNLFTLIWGVLLTLLVTLFSSRRGGLIVYGVLHALAVVYAAVQAGAYMVLGRLLFISDFLYAAEGNDYAGYALNFVTPAYVLGVLALLVVGLVGAAVFPKKQCTNGRMRLVRLGIAAAAIAGLFCVPGLYEYNYDEQAWNSFDDPANEYTRFVNANFDMQLAGMYQYIVKDIGTQVERRMGQDPSGVETINAFFESMPEHAGNEMSGIFEGKNLLIVMMESVDDWLIDAQNTPTMYRMMTEGISFANMYTPQYSNGYTFNTEFAFNTSVYPYTNGNVAYDLVRSDMSHTLANALRRKGYCVNSFHMGLASFYNRGIMHQAFGYERYYSYQDYGTLSMEMYDDSFLLEQEQLRSLAMPQEDFCSFVISFSGHLPYTDEDELVQYALERYPQYGVQEDREVNLLRAKVRLTDDMFAGILQKLEEEGRLEDTVIVAFSDHYAYGLSDKARLQQFSQEAGSSILERTPAFIYCAGYDAPMTVDKVTQVTDLAPTIMNLFGLDVPKEMMGRDVFDDNYPGYAIFPSNTWLTGKAYMKNGTLQWNEGMTNEEVSRMNAYVQQVYEINDKILDTDYYSVSSN